MAAPSPLSVHLVCIGGIDIGHHLAHVALRRFYGQMIIVGHKNIAMQPVALLFPGLFKVGFELSIIRLGKKNPFPLIATSGYVVKSPFIFNM